MTPHTQGPWTVAGEGFVVGGEGDATNADFVSLTYITAPMVATNYSPAAGEREANAHLMAAAPDLLAAVRALLHDIDTGLLVRDIRRDAQPGWTTNMVAFVQRLQAAQRAVLKAEEGR
jgi:hypothetical protein